jgi:ABC-type transport system involved in cytochrome bd biosynthesis fused ATPase/permease subunit
VLDEPTAHLDAGTAGALLDDLWQVAGRRSVLLVTHGGAGPFERCPRVTLERPGPPPDDFIPSG